MTNRNKIGLVAMLISLGWNASGDLPAILVCVSGIIFGIGMILFMSPGGV